jgi:predicted double-glycine peptidase
MNLLDFKASICYHISKRQVEHERLKMVLWLETAGVVLVAVSSVLLGWLFSHFKKPYWTLGYFFPCALISLLIIARFNNALYFISPFSWFIAGRARFVILCLAVSMGLSVPLSRLPYRFEKILVCIILFVVVTWFSVMPFLMPAMIKGHLLSMKTRFDSKGICRQSTDYTCGPAAAVTALGKLGLSAKEGEIAVLSQSSPVVGTLPTLLCSALEKRYGDNGLKCEYRRFNSIDQLKKAGITLVVIKDAFLIDHCIVVFEVQDDAVAIADPITGAELIPIEKFEKIWRYSGIVLECDSLQSI